MSQGRDEAGRFEKTVTEQDILKIFDYEDDPVLTAPEVADGLRRFGKQITPEGVRNRLEEMADKGLVSRKKLGARAVGWWAEVAPELADETAECIETRRGSDDWSEL
ncbi:winged-helix domain-containing protein [Halorubrum sp. PV6]|uniref:winged-helix domain-containing protein n=1 Tax=Halorubrum sp. PV6 TaxID=634157 RepID=UPI0011983C1E|nr:winged-helix domain-containing protein [Halorubrum sp. PV6]AZQ16059.1 helix-turn-helix domain-containing protein [Halorubrum sp. PV6]